MQVTLWALAILIWASSPAAYAQDTPDSLLRSSDSSLVIVEPAILYVIPAGPIAGSFTEASRVQIVDTVAGWARVLVEGWVPVAEVLPRITAEAQTFQFAEPERVKKPKAERPQCISTTTKGKRCSRKAMAGSKKCWQHSQ